MSRDVRKPDFFAYAKTKTKISFAVTAKLISVFVFATRIVQSLHFLNPNFQVSSYTQWLRSPVCVGPGRKPRRSVFWRRGSYDAVQPGFCQSLTVTKETGLRCCWSDCTDKRTEFVSDARIYWNQIIARPRLFVVPFPGFIFICVSSKP